MQGLDFSVVWPYLGIIWTGVVWTAIITVCASAVSVIGGIALAVAVLYGPPLLT
jgi:polar amino acid transport system permease protein